MSAAISSQQADRLFGSGVRDQALMLLGRGLSTGKVAMLLEVSPALISQYKAEPQFASRLEEMLLEKALAAQLRDEALDALEDELIDKVKESIVFITKPMEAVKALQAINSMKRRTDSEIRTFDNSEKGTIVLELPAYVRQANISIQYNTNNEVVEVDGRAMQTMQSTEVLDKLQQMQQARLQDGRNIKISSGTETAE